MPKPHYSKLDCVCDNCRQLAQENRDLRRLLREASAAKGRGDTLVAQPMTGDKSVAATQGGGRS